MKYLAILLFFIIGIYLLYSGIRLFIKERENDKKWWDYLDVILDIISDPISSEGLRIYLGGILILAVLLLVFNVL
ncbi:hypothetical protein [Heyndrickxia oleronia]|uniref:hypothetical protein n=1 Tax=Heyndrickxia oleronia TaxID=38875 RepID=UPI00242AF1A7|nr:hypothetical protein [Heyndrickxia oleronia]MCI1591192.1 hypothetical protein [Heyndrickxia oleronia]MCI1615333.1 hypothetical protein [Heyndrickxia oleronia]MCI1746108.1 hypothetical protein [Heyndrickxia oleronia]MCI1763457.1 hypothetical protein [Heyndrickxia oleronia]